MATTLDLGNNNSLPDVETTFITEEVLKTSDSITSNTPPQYLHNFQDFSMNPQITENYVKPVEFLPSLSLLVQNISRLSICDCSIGSNDVKESFNQSPNSTQDFLKQNRENFHMENPVTGDASTINNKLLCTIGSIDISMGKGDAATFHPLYSHISSPGLRSRNSNLNPLTDIFILGEEVLRRREVNSSVDLENQVSNLTCGDLREISTPIAHEIPSHVLSEVATIDNCEKIPFLNEEASLDILLC